MSSDSDPGLPLADLLYGARRRRRLSDPLSFLWLEITGQCQLACRHCYADSGPRGTHGTMTLADWTRVIDEASLLGVSLVQLIGGEPTLHPQFPELVEHALGHGLEVEVYTNLVRVTGRLWDLFEHPGVRLATSYYSPDAVEHDAVTGRHSHDRTLANIREAVRRQIRLRVGVIDLTDGQRVAEAVAELHGLGVNEVGVDRLRQVGRGCRGRETGVDQLCGRCAEEVLAVSPEGEVWPCVFARWMVIGDVRDSSLADLNAAACGTRADLAEVFRRRASAAQACDAGDCRPVEPDWGCDPRPCKPLTQPRKPSRR